MITTVDLNNLLRAVVENWSQSQQFHQDEPPGESYKDWLFALVLLKILSKEDYDKIIDWLDDIDDPDLTLAFLVGGESLIEQLMNNTDEAYVYEVLCRHLNVKP